MPRGWRVWHLKISRLSALRRYAVSLNPVLTTDTIVSSVVCPGEEKCFATGRRAFLKTPEDFLGPKSYVMFRLFTNRDSISVRFES